MEINQGSFCLRLVKKTDGVLFKDTVKSLVMDPPFRRQLNCRDL